MTQNHTEISLPVPWESYDERQTITGAGEGEEKQAPSHVASDNVHDAATLEK